MYHPNGRRLTDHEIALINGTNQTKHKPESVLEIHVLPNGSRIAHNPRGDMQRIKQRQRRTEGSQRGLFAAVVLDQDVDGQAIHAVLSDLPGYMVQYQPNDGANNLWHASVETELEPEEAHRHIAKAFTKQITQPQEAPTVAASIKGIF